MSGNAIETAAILLAAGLSRRMGGENKLLIEIAGEPLVRRTAKTYLAAGTKVHVVLGHEAERVRAALAGLPLSFITNPNYRDGQPSSVQAGFESLQGSPELILVALSDQPALTRDDIAGLVRAFTQGAPDRILIPFFKGHRGNPVAVPACLLEDIRAAGGFADLRSFIDAHPGRASRFEAPNSHYIIDIDTPADAAAFTGARVQGPA